MNFDLINFSIYSFFLRSNFSDFEETRRKLGPETTNNATSCSLSIKLLTQFTVGSTTSYDNELRQRITLLPFPLSFCTFYFSFASTVDWLAARPLTIIDRFWTWHRSLNDCQPANLKIMVQTSPMWQFIQCTRCLLSEFSDILSFWFSQILLESSQNKRFTESF